METTMAPLVWINGFPGSGKLTVAKAITMLDQEAIVIDNHKLIDPVEAKFSRSHPNYQQERQLYRQAVLSEYVRGPANLSRLVIFTDFQSSNELGRDVAMEYKDAAKGAGRPFLPVYLTCDYQANLDRVASQDRLSSGTGKLTDVELLKEMRSKCELFRFDSCAGLTVDSTQLLPSEIATQVLAFIRENQGLSGSQ